MDFELPEELKLLAQSVREYVQTRLEPVGGQVEREDRIPAQILQEMGELGYFGVPFPERYGGMGAGELGYCVLLEELGATNAAFSNVIGATSGLCATAVWLGGDEAQRERYLPELVAGRRMGSYALSEPNAGSDAASLATTARRAGDHYVLNGTKHFITNAPIADVFVVFAATDRKLGARGGISAFVLERGTPGMSVGKPDEKMGLRGSTTSEVVFEDCAVPVANLLGQEGTGFGIALKTLERGRISLSAGCVGTAQDLLRRCVGYAKQREQFNQPIGSFQAIQWMLAEMALGVHAGRLMVYQAADRVDRGVSAGQEAALTKLYCSEMAGRAADNAVQIHGGLGYMKESPIERIYRDARVLRIYEGTSEIQRVIVAGELLR